VASLWKWPRTTPRRVRCAARSSRLPTSPSQVCVAGACKRQTSTSYSTPTRSAPCCAGSTTRLACARPARPTPGARSAVAAGNGSASTRRRMGRSWAPRSWAVRPATGRPPGTASPSRRAATTTSSRCSAKLARRTRTTSSSTAPPGHRTTKRWRPSCEKRSPRWRTGRHPRREARLPDWSRRTESVEVGCGLSLGKRAWRRPWSRWRPSHA